MTSRTRRLGAFLTAVLCASALGVGDRLVEVAKVAAENVAAAKVAVANPPPPACGTACRLFNNTARLDPANEDAFPVAITDHPETSSVIWKGQYIMYYRTFIALGGNQCSIPQGIAMATSTDFGITWKPVNDGRPLPALQTVQEKQSCTYDDRVKSTWVYAPDVISDGSRLVMAFEQRDRVPDYNGPGKGRALHTIRYITSTDGHNWENNTLLLNHGPVGAWDDEVGTPDLEKDGTGYVMTFHAHDSTDRLRQTRALIRFPSLTGEFTGERQRVVLDPAPDWANFGVGMSDMTREGDGNWYIVFEAFSGVSGACARPDTKTTVGVARSSDVRTWTVRPDPIISGGDPLSCGWDMPSWQLIGKARGIVTPNDPPERNRLVRWNIVDK